MQNACKPSKALYTLVDRNLSIQRIKLMSTWLFVAEGTGSQYKIDMLICCFEIYTFDTDTAITVATSLTNYGFVILVIKVHRLTCDSVMKTTQLLTVNKPHARAPSLFRTM